MIKYLDLLSIRFKKSQLFRNQLLRL